MPRAYKTALVEWLNSQALDGDITVATADSPQILSTLTSGVNYHWIHHRTTPEDIRVLAEELGVDYVIVPPTMGKPQFLKRPTLFLQYFHHVGSWSNSRVYAAEVQGAPAP